MYTRSHAAGVFNNAGACAFRGSNRAGRPINWRACAQIWHLHLIFNFSQPTTATTTTPAMSDSEQSDQAPAVNNSSKGARKRVAGDKPDADKLPVPTPSRPCTLDTKILGHCELVRAGIDSTSDFDRRQRIKAESAAPADVWAHAEFDPDRDLWVFEHRASGDIVWGTPCRQGKNREKEPDCKRGTYRMYAAATMLANAAVKAAVDAGEQELFEGAPMCTALAEGPVAAAPAKKPAAPAAPRPPRVRKPAAPKAAPAPAPPMGESFMSILRRELPIGDAVRTPVQMITRIAMQCHQSEDGGHAILEPLTTKEIAASKDFDSNPRSRLDCMNFTTKYFSTTLGRIKNGENAVDAPLVFATRSAQCAIAIAEGIYNEQQAAADARAAIICAERDAAMQEVAELRAQLETNERELAMLRLGPNTLGPRIAALRERVDDELMPTPPAARSSSSSSSSAAAKPKTKRVPKSPENAKKRLLVESDDDDTVEPAAAPAIVPAARDLSGWIESDDE